jgi:hypothetical protein
MAVWAAYLHPQRRTNSTWRLKGPHAQPITICLPGTTRQALQAYDQTTEEWVALEPVEPDARVTSAACTGVIWACWSSRATEPTPRLNAR